MCLAYSLYFLVLVVASATQMPDAPLGRFINPPRPGGWWIWNVGDPAPLHEDDSPDAWMGTFQQEPDFFSDLATIEEETGTPLSDE